MSQESVEIVRRLLEPFEGTDIAAIFRDDAGSAAMRAALSSVYAPDFEGTFDRGAFGRTVYSGLDGLWAVWLDWLSPWTTYRTEIESVIDAGEGRVVVFPRDYGCREGMETEVSIDGAAVWTVRNGQIAHIDFYNNHADGLAAAGLAE